MKMNSTDALQARIAQRFFKHYCNWESEQVEGYPFNLVAFGRNNVLHFVKVRLVMLTRKIPYPADEILSSAEGFWFRDGATKWLEENNMVKNYKVAYDELVVSMGWINSVSGTIHWHRNIFDKPELQCTIKLKPFLW